VKEVKVKEEKHKKDKEPEIFMGKWEIVLNKFMYTYVYTYTYMFKRDNRLWSIYLKSEKLTTRYLATTDFTTNYSANLYISTFIGIIGSPGSFCKKKGAINMVRTTFESKQYMQGIYIH
jgi:hypothetical protein